VADKRKNRPLSVYSEARRKCDRYFLHAKKLSHIQVMVELHCRGFLRKEEVCVCVNANYAWGKKDGREKVNKIYFLCTNGFCA